MCIVIMVSGDIIRRERGTVTTALSVGAAWCVATTTAPSLGQCSTPRMTAACGPGMTRTAWTRGQDVRGEMLTMGDAALLLVPVWRVRGIVIMTRSVMEVWSVVTTTANNLETFSIPKMTAA